MIERAELKLRLDAMVIQQGRLADRSTKMSKGELVALIRYGADEVFRYVAVPFSCAACLPPSVNVSVFGVAGRRIPRSPTRTLTLSCRRAPSGRSS